MNLDQPSGKPQPMPIPLLSTIATEDAQAAAIAQAPDLNIQASRWINERDPAAWKRALQILASSSSETTLILALMQMRRALLLHYNTLDECGLATVLHCLVTVANAAAGSRKIVHDAATLYAVLVRKIAEIRDQGKSYTERSEGRFFPVEYIQIDTLPLPFATELVRGYAANNYEQVHDMDGAVFVGYNGMVAGYFRRLSLVPIAQTAMQRIRTPRSAVDRIDALDLLVAVLEIYTDGNDASEDSAVTCALRMDHNVSGTAEDDDLLGNVGFYADVMRTIDAPALRMLCAIARCRIEEKDKVQGLIKQCIVHLLTVDGGQAVMCNNDIHHEACRLICTLLYNHHRISNKYLDDASFLQLLIAFSGASIAAWKTVPHGMHYMMAAWYGAAAAAKRADVSVLPVIAGYVSARLCHPSEDDAMAIDGRFDVELNHFADVVRLNVDTALEPLLNVQPSADHQHMWAMLMWAAMIRQRELGNAARQKVLGRALEVIKTPLAEFAARSVHVQNAFVVLSNAIYERCLRYGGFDFGTVEQHFASSTQLRYTLIAKISAMLGAADGSQPDYLERALSLLTALLTGAVGDSVSLTNIDDATLARMMALRDSLFARADGNRTFNATRIAFYTHLGSIVTKTQFKNLLLASFEHRLAQCPPDNVPAKVGILVDLTGLLIAQNSSTIAARKYAHAVALVMRYLKASVSDSLNQRDVFLQRAKMLHVLMDNLRISSVKIDVFDLFMAVVDCIAKCGTHFAKDERVLIVMLRLWRVTLTTLNNDGFIQLRMALDHYDSSLYNRLLRMTGLLPKTVGPDALQRQPKLIAPFYGILASYVDLDASISSQRGDAESIGAILRAIATGIECTDRMDTEYDMRGACMRMVEKLARRARKNEKLKAALLPFRDQLLSLFLRTPFTLDLAFNFRSSTCNMAALYALLVIHPSFTIAKACSDLQTAWLKDMLSYAACGYKYDAMKKEVRADGGEKDTWTLARPPDLSAVLASFAI